MVNTDWELVTTRVLDRGKALAPDRFPKVDSGVVDAWSQVFSRIGVSESTLIAAVDLWCAEMAGDRMITPRDFRQAIKVLLSRWESDPVKGPQLRAWRHAREVERDRQLAEGTFAEIRGYTPKQITPKKAPEGPTDGLKYRLKGSG